MLEKFQKTAK